MAEALRRSRVLWEAMGACAVRSTCLGKRVGATTNA